MSFKETVCTLLGNSEFTKGSCRAREILSLHSNNGLGGGSNMFHFHPYLGKIPILTNIFQMGWNHEPVVIGYDMTLNVNIQYNRTLASIYILHTCLCFSRALICLFLWYGFFTYRCLPCFPDSGFPHCDKTMMAAGWWNVEWWNAAPANKSTIDKHHAFNNCIPKPALNPFENMLTYINSSN